MEKSWEETVRDYARDELAHFTLSTYDEVIRKYSDIISDLVELNHQLQECTHRHINFMRSSDATFFEIMDFVDPGVEYQTQKPDASPAPRSAKTK